MGPKLDEKFDKRLIIYAAIIIICIIAVGIGVYTQFFYKHGDDDPLGIGIGTGTTIDVNEEEEKEKQEKVKTGFDTLFINALTYTSSNFNNSVRRKDASKDLVYTSNEYSKTVDGKYSMNINVPEINVESVVANEINNSIGDTFVKKATSILANADLITDYTIYNIDYTACVNGDILSLLIRATLKEGSKPQRIMYLGYNYNLKTGTKITLQDYMEYKGITEATLQNKINKEIEKMAQNTQNLSSILGTSLYKRNTSDKMYKVENVNNYYYGADGYVYVIYAYGNSNYTSETDIILF